LVLVLVHVLSLLLVQLVVLIMCLLILLSFFVLFSFLRWWIVGAHELELYLHRRNLSVWKFQSNFQTANNEQLLSRLERCSDGANNEQNERAKQNGSEHRNAEQIHVQMKTWTKTIHTYKHMHTHEYCFTSLMYNF
jgi:biopolymer transport protein ExbB/TolQ